MAITPMGPGAAPISPPTAAPASKANGMVGVFADMLEDVNADQLDADAAFNDLVSGESENVHDVVLSMAKADLSFRMVIEIRNQVLSAYQDLQRMQF
ncbi:MAG: flagellar hook-basal body complex protein FliE [bacterium]|nr:flagellar hook-basal body complex protein FliE [bacterium]